MQKKKKNEILHRCFHFKAAIMLWTESYAKDIVLQQNNDI